MVEHDGNTLRAVAWAEVFPWLSIVRSFRMAIAARALVFGAAGILLTAIGWWFVAAMFGTDTPATKWLEPFATCPWLAVTQAVPDHPSLPNMASSTDGASPFQRSEHAAYRPWCILTRPAFEGLAHTGLPVSAVASVLLCGLWATAVWAFFGAAICRIAAVQLAAEEQVGWAAALRYAARKWPAYFAAPLFPIGGVLLATIPVAVLGFIMRVTRAAVGRAAVAVGAGGWAFDGPVAVGHALRLAADVGHDQCRRHRQLRRPEPHLRLRVPAAVALSVLCGRGRFHRLARLAAGAELRCGRHLDGLLGGRLGMRQRTDRCHPEPWRGIGGIGSAGAVLVRFWAECVKLLAVGYLFSYFWGCGGHLLPLAPRRGRHRNGRSISRRRPKRRDLGLPAIATDQAGAPVVEDEEEKTMNAE